MNDIVLTNPAPAVNPFAKSGIDYSGLAVGNTAIESERAIAEAQGALTLAKRFPRNQANAFGQIMETCKRRAFAETSTYAYPRGGKTVTGPSIRLAEELARAWGNIDYGIRELSRNQGFSEMEAYAWDLQTNTRTSTRFTVNHTSLSRDQKELTDARDIYERIANDGARRLRARILAILPPDLVDAAEEQCRQTLAGNTSEPIADRARKMIVAFSKLGVGAELIQARLGHSIDAAVPDEFIDLQQIYCSIRDGYTKASDWFSGNQPPPANDELEAKLGPTTPPPPRRGRPPNATKNAAGAVDPTPDPVPPTAAQPPQVDELGTIEQAIASLAGKIRQMKSAGVDQSEIDAAEITKDGLKKRYLELKTKGGIDVGF